MVYGLAAHSCKTILEAVGVLMTDYRLGTIADIQCSESYTQPYRFTCVAMLKGIGVYMWTAKETSLSKSKHSEPYNYFNQVHHYGYIGKTETMQELIDYIRNPEDSYEKPHLKKTDEDGAKYMLTIRSICQG